MREARKAGPRQARRDGGGKAKPGEALWRAPPVASTSPTRRERLDFDEVWRSQDNASS